MDLMIHWINITENKTKKTRQISSYVAKILENKDLIWKTGNTWLYNSCAEFANELKRANNLELCKDMI